jgi:hypothetical protein
MMRLPTLFGFVLALALLSVAVSGCATCEAKGNNGGQSGRCGLFGTF